MSFLGVSGYILCICVSLLWETWVVGKSWTLVYWQALFDMNTIVIMCYLGSPSEDFNWPNLRYFSSSLSKSCFTDVSYPYSPTQGCARFAEILQNCVVRQVFERMCSIVFLAFTLKLPIQTLLSVAPTHSSFLVHHTISAKRAQPYTWQTVHTKSWQWRGHCTVLYKQHSHPTLSWGSWSICLSGRKTQMT